VRLSGKKERNDKDLDRNPGVASFYHSFRKHLLALKLPVFVIGHSAHFVDKGLKDDVYFGLKVRQSSLCCLCNKKKDQVAHKISVLNYIKENYGNKQTKFVLIAHSIGCWMNIQIREKIPELVCYSIHCW
jgi:Lipid-droplet associated hydrolase